MCACRAKIISEGLHLPGLSPGLTKGLKGEIIEIQTHPTLTMVGHDSAESVNHFRNHVMVKGSELMKALEHSWERGPSSPGPNHPKWNDDDLFMLPQEDLEICIEG